MDLASILSVPLSVSYSAGCVRKPCRRQSTWEEAQGVQDGAPPHAPYHPGPVPRSTFWLGSFQLVFFRLNLRSKPFTCAIESEPFTCASAPELLVQLFEKSLLILAYDLGATGGAVVCTPAVFVLRSITN